MSEADCCPDSDEEEEADAVLNQDTQQSGEHRYLSMYAATETKAAIELKHLDIEDVQLCAP